jgi:hypothetical protein
LLISQGQHQLCARGVQAGLPPLLLPLPGYEEGASLIVSYQPIQAAIRRGKQYRDFSVSKKIKVSLFYSRKNDGS